MILVRHGLMIIGETLSGKTSAYKALSKTLNDLNELGLLNESKVKCFFYNLLYCPWHLK